MTETENPNFEQARDELREIIQTLEAGSAPLEETLKLWARGEILAKTCRSILERALNEIQRTQSVSSESPSEPLGPETA